MSRELLFCFYHWRTQSYLGFRVSSNCLSPCEERCLWIDSPRPPCAMAGVQDASATLCCGCLSSASWPISYCTFPMEKPGSPLRITLAALCGSSLASQEAGCWCFYLPVCSLCWRKKIAVAAVDMTTVARAARCSLPYWQLWLASSDPVTVSSWPHWVWLRDPCVWTPRAIGTTPLPTPKDSTCWKLTPGLSA